MATIQIRNVRDEDYQALREAAEAEGKSLQAYMQEQASVLARRAKKKAAFDAARSALAADTGTGVTTESILADLDAIRGPWPGEESAARGR
ncbi:MULTISPECIES: antitoxin [Prauserella]|nr:MULTISPECIES: antitoxin [Prauserella]PXY32932.1 hypothetical protein BAY59_07350 [Prauserella coralliicola]